MNALFLFQKGENNNNKIYEEVAKFISEVQFKGISTDWFP